MTSPLLLFFTIASAAVAQSAECDDETANSAADHPADAGAATPIGPDEAPKSFQLQPIASLICDIKDFPRPEPTDDESASEDATDDDADGVERQPQVIRAMLWQDGETVIRTSDEFAQWWKKAPWDENLKPEVDFEKSILLIYAYNAGNTSLRGGWHVLVTPDGLCGASASYITKEMWRRTNQFRVLFFAVPKQEVDEYLEAVQQAATENRASDSGADENTEAHTAATAGESEPNPNGDAPAEGEGESDDAEAEAWANSMFVVNGRRMAIIGVVPFANLTCAIKDFPKFESSDDEATEEVAWENLTDEERAQRNSEANMRPFGRCEAEFRSSDEFDNWWKKTPWEDKQKPEVNFEKSILVVCAYNDGVPNSCSFVVHITEEGTAGVGISTMTKQAGFTISDNYRVWFFAVPKKTIDSFAKASAATSEQSSDTDSHAEGTADESQPDSNGEVPNEATETD